MKKQMIKMMIMITMGKSEERRKEENMVEVPKADRIQRKKNNHSLYWQNGKGTVWKGCGVGRGGLKLSCARRGVLKWYNLSSLCKPSSFVPPKQRL